MTQDDLFQTATYLQQGIPASHLVRPGSDEARKMTVTSGRKYLPLLKQNSLAGAFSRMFLDTSVWASTKCYLTWKAKVTPSNRLLFQLAPSMPRTEETGSGLWRTPLAADGTHNHCLAPSVLEGRTTMTLTNQVKGGQAGMWPTPTTQDNPQIAGQGKAKGTKRGTTLGGAVRMWATPTAAIAQGSSAGNPNRKKAGRDLRQDVRMWPTPTANEDAAGTPTGKMQAMLGNHPDVRGTTPEEWAQGSLNPAWVEWLMGYPPGWTNLETSQE